MENKNLKPRTAASDKGGCVIHGQWALQERAEAFDAFHPLVNVEAFLGGPHTCVPLEGIFVAGKGGRGTGGVFWQVVVLLEE